MKRGKKESRASKLTVVTNLVKKPQKQHQTISPRTIRFPYGPIKII